MLFSKNEFKMDVHKYDAYLLSKYAGSEFEKHHRALNKRETNPEYIIERKDLQRVVLVDRNAKETARGLMGEYEAFYLLDKYLPGKKLYLFDVSIPINGGVSYAEIDLLVFWRNTIIVCEAKRYEGRLHANPNERDWEYDYGPDFSSHYVQHNFYEQNWFHFLALCSYLEKSGILMDYNKQIVPVCCLSRSCNYQSVNENWNSVEIGLIPQTLIKILFSEREENVASSLFNFIKRMEIISENCEDQTEEMIMKAYHELSQLNTYTRSAVNMRETWRNNSAQARSGMNRKRYFVSKDKLTLYRENDFATERLRMTLRNGVPTFNWEYCDSVSCPHEEDVVPVDDPQRTFSEVSAENAAYYRLISKYANGRVSIHIN